MRQFQHAVHGHGTIVHQRITIADGVFHIHGIFALHIAIHDQCTAVFHSHGSRLDLDIFAGDIHPQCHIFRNCKVGNDAGIAHTPSVAVQSDFMSVIIRDPEVERIAVEHAFRSKPVVFHRCCRFFGLVGTIHKDIAGQRSVPCPHRSICTAGLAGLIGSGIHCREHILCSDRHECSPFCNIAFRIVIIVLDIAICRVSGADTVPCGKAFDRILQHSAVHDVRHHDFAIERFTDHIVHGISAERIIDRAVVVGVESGILCQCTLISADERITGLELCRIGQKQVRACCITVCIQCSIAHQDRIQNGNIGCGIIHRHRTDTFPVETQSGNGTVQQYQISCTVVIDTAKHICRRFCSMVGNQSRHCRSGNDKRCAVGADHAHGIGIIDIPFIFRKERIADEHGCRIYGIVCSLFHDHIRKIIAPDLRIDQLDAGGIARSFDHRRRFVVVGVHAIHIK